MPAQRTRRWLDGLHRAEDMLLAALVAALLLLSVSQIGLRVFFDTGLAWAEAAGRAGVLWLALLGALAATRERRHIAIDVLPRLLPPRLRRLAWAVAQLAASALCGSLAWLGWGLVRLEREAPVPFIEGIPSWVPMLALPLGFGLMALRFLLTAGTGPGADRAPGAPPSPETGEGARP
ncbi:TRAP transporter small permease [Arenimonas fontis]|uniref:TRAP transporter small permease protein n=1 Tax=Arenimonas fontis TaxID=2608255 RepID=A0A5B2Z928_9GAMM|nr:TRAP transporter small permease [Arenimonas fontis]KAA2284417.1 TRAP transporter small permease [Arenimonas fontis]